MKSLGCRYPNKKIDDEVVNVSALPLSMDDASIESVSVLMVEVDALAVDVPDVF